MNSRIIAAISILSIICGAIFGLLTRPSILGMPVPLGILTSDAPFNAPFRQASSRIWSFSIGAGVIGAGVLLVILGILTGNRASRA